MTTYRGSDGQSYSLGKRFGGGGEGEVFEVTGRPEALAKLWFKPDNEREQKLYVERQQKLYVLMRHKPEVTPKFRQTLGLAWPSVALSNDDGVTVGFLMPLAPPDTYRKVYHYFVPAARQELEKSLGSPFSRKQLVKMARNFSLLVLHMHHHRYIIGDINGRNVLASADGRVFLIDIDSVQFTDPETGRIYPCSVHVPEFTPPRLLQGRNASTERVVEDDLFGLAIILFQLLMGGLHPYDLIERTGNGLDARVENIKANRSPFVRLDLNQARTWVNLLKMPDEKLRDRAKRNFLAGIKGKATADFESLILPRVQRWLDLEPEFRDLFALAFAE